MTKFVAELTHTVTYTASVTVEVPDGAEEGVIEQAILKHVADDRAKPEGEQEITWDLNDDDIEIEGYDEE